MTKAIVKMKCKEPNCTHPHDIEVDLPEPNVIEGTISTSQILTPATTTPAPPVQEEKPRKLKHEELEEIIPTNYGKCPGGDCGHQKIKGKNQAKKFKVCSNDKCESNSVRKDQPCPTCGKDYDIDSWKDLEDGVDLTEDEDGD